MQDIQSVIIEGGAHTLTSFINEGLWDEARVFTGETVLGRGIKAPCINGISGREHIIGTDRLKFFYHTPVN